MLPVVGGKECCGRGQKTRALFLCRNDFRECFDLVKESDAANKSPLPPNQEIGVSSKRRF